MDGVFLHRTPVQTCSLGDHHNLWPGAGPGGPPLTLGFEAPKLTIFGPDLIFP